jgi:hypothetical protein
MEAGGRRQGAGGTYLIILKKPVKNPPKALNQCFLVTRSWFPLKKPTLNK